MRIALLLVALTMPLAAAAGSLKHLSAVDEIQELDERLNAWYHARGRFPTNDEGLHAVVRSIGDSITTDPWGQAYQYRHPAQHSRRTFEIWSVGVDGVDEQGQGDDLSSWARFDPSRYPKPDGNWPILMTILLFDLPVLMLAALIGWLMSRRRPVVDGQPMRAHPGCEAT